MTKAEREKLARILVIGSQMSNALYNLHQGDNVPSKRDREIMAKLVREWDAAHWDGTTARGERP